MPRSTAPTRVRLPDSAFAYVDARGRRKLPIHDEAHVRNALARFDQTRFEDDASRERARARLLRAAKKYGIVPIGFMTRQLRSERRAGEAGSAARLGRLPTGLVTLLLADVEASTRLVTGLGERYAGVLEEVRSIIRVAVTGAGGAEVDARADEYFAAFGRAGDALAAALTIQRRLADHRWEAGLRVRVRVGLHSGRPTLTDGAYVGVAVNMAARVCAAGHGGQILVSSTAQGLLDRSLPDGVALRDLGTYRLQGLPRPETLFQVDPPGPPVDFPPLRTAAATPSSPDAT